MATSCLSPKRRSSDNDDEAKENNQQYTSSTGMKRTKVMIDEQMKIRNEIVDEFRKRDLSIPFQIIGNNFDFCYTDYKYFCFCYLIFRCN